MSYKTKDTTVDTSAEGSVDIVIDVSDSMKLGANTSGFSNLVCEVINHLITFMASEESLKNVAFGITYFSDSSAVEQLEYDNRKLFTRDTARIQKDVKDLLYTNSSPKDGVSAYAADALQFSCAKLSAACEATHGRSALLFFSDAPHYVPTNRQPVFLPDASILFCYLKALTATPTLRTWFHNGSRGLAKNHNDEAGSTYEIMPWETLVANYQKDTASLHEYVVRNIGWALRTSFAGSSSGQA